MQRIWGWFYSEKCFFLPNKLADKEHACKRESWEIFYRFLTNLELLPHDSCAINCTEIRKEHLYIVKDKWNVSHDSLIHACSLSASSCGKKKRFSRYNLPQILFMCSKALWSNDRLLCYIEISGKTQNYRLKSVCSFKVTRFYLILLCKQHNWTSGTYSIEISTWSYENRVSKFF